MLLKLYKKQVHMFKWGYMINGNENETEMKKNISQRYNTNRPRSRHGHK